MKLISWNVNGIRACITKGFYDVIKEMDADIFCIQESKMQEGQAVIETDGYYQYYNSAEKKGYSGVIVFTKVKPISVTKGMGITEHDLEGRLLTLEYETFYLVNVYTPNAKEKLARITYRMLWEKEFKDYLKKLEQHKPVIICGDMNVAHQEIDLKNPKQNRGNAGFSDLEREAFTNLLSDAWIDTYRYFYKEKENAYTWWSYRFDARNRNIGWRIDYFLVSSSLEKNLIDAMIYQDVMGSDHCPVGLQIDC